jgi:glycosyltransferase involved in cell wall biosynthesis
MEEVKGFRPQVIYTMLGSNLMLSLVLDMYAQHRVPIVPHMMDDWPATLYRRSLFRPLLRGRLERELRSVLSASPARLTIGEEMAAEYARRYGGPFEPFMNAVEREWLVWSEPESIEGRRLRFTYVGGLHLNRWQSLREIGAAIADLRSEGLEAELVVHTQPRFAAESKLLELPDVVRVMGSLDPSQVAPALRMSDVLVHVESFDDQSRAYTRYSVSTKIPECMGAARPILAYGPDELASVSYVASSGAGIAVGRRDPVALRNAVRKLLTSRDLRRDLGARGFEVARRQHDASTQRERFREVLAAAAGTTGAGRAEG